MQLPKPAIKLILFMMTPLNRLEHEVEGLVEVGKNLKALLPFQKDEVVGFRVMSDGHVDKDGLLVS